MKGFHFDGAAQQNFVHALQHNLAGLEVLRLAHCCSSGLGHHNPEWGGLDEFDQALVGMFEQGCGAHLKVLSVTVMLFQRDLTPLDARMAAAITAGACPMLKDVICGSRTVKARDAARRRQGWSK